MAQGIEFQRWRYSGQGCGLGTCSSGATRSWLKLPALGRFSSSKSLRKRPHQDRDWGSIMLSAIGARRLSG